MQGSKRYKARETEIEKTLTARQKLQEIENYIIATDKQKIAIEKITENVIYGSKWLFIYGGPGTGKGHICTAIYKERLRSFKSAIYINAFDMFRELKLNYLKPEVLEKYYTTNTLIIDEIEKFAGTTKNDEKDYLFAIINRRYENYLQTIIISNATYGDVERLLTAPILDRFSEMGGTINFDWPSHRSK